MLVRGLHSGYAGTSYHGPLGGSFALLVSCWFVTVAPAAGEVVVVGVVVGGAVVVDGVVVG